MRVVLLLSLAVASAAFGAGPEDAERFTHFAGFNLADLPSFEDIAKKFGAAPIRHSGDAADSDSRVCYRTADGKGAFEFSRGEVDWGYVFRQARTADNACPETEAVSTSQFTAAGVTIGMGKESYERVVGHPTESTTDRMKHEFQYVHVLTNSERWDVVISLTASFFKGRLASFAVNRVETN